MVKTFIRKMWVLILVVLVVLVYLLFIGDYTSKELITRYKDEIKNPSCEYDDIIDDIKAMPIEIKTVSITCTGKDTTAFISNLEDDKWETNYSFPSRFVKFMNKHLYYFSGIVSCYNKKYIRFVFSKTDEPLKASGEIYIRMFYCDNDNIEGLKNELYSGYDFIEINDSSLDHVNDMKENWIYKIKDNWYVVGVHLKQKNKSTIDLYHSKAG